jgi:hypothetical protein
MRQVLRLFAVAVLAHETVLESCDSIRHDGSQPPRVRPEALGSPEGYAVLPGHCLLWPHPSLWIRNRAISAFPATAPEESAQGGDPEVPQFTPQDCPSVPSPLPRRLRECVWLLLPHERWPSPMSKRLGIRKVHFRGCRVRVMLRPGRWLDLLEEAVYFRAFVWPVARTRRRV